MLQALALRYRPRNFGELVGQEAVSTSLTHALDENRLTHAYLFSGLRGSGKTSSARIFSKALVCDRGPTSTPCEQCANCIAANEGRHIDIIEMDAASHRGIDDVKGLIEQTKYAPAVARFKIFIIDEVHMLSTPAFNALLKTLEEPPAYVKFILATTDPLKLPATVLSRTQHFRFRQISRPDVVAHLDFILNRENIPHEKEALQILARSGAGSLRDTLTLLDQAIIYAKGELTQSAVAQMLGLLDPQRIEEILALVMSGDKAAVSAAVAQLESYDAEMIIDEITANLKANFLAQSPKYSLLLYERFFRILSQARGMLSVSSDGGFVLGVMLFMMIEATNLKSIDEMIASGARENLALSQGRAGEFGGSQTAANFAGGRERANFASTREGEAAKFTASARAGQSAAGGLNLTGEGGAGWSNLAGSDKFASQNGATRVQNLSSAGAEANANEAQGSTLASNSASNLSATDLPSSVNLSSAVSASSSNSAAQAPSEVSGDQTRAAKTPNPAYEAFLAKIYDRSFDLGECFKNCIEFLDFSDGCMSLASSAAGEDQRRLREGSKVILQILRALFGESAKIKITPRQSPEIEGSQQNLAVGGTAKFGDGQNEQNLTSENDKMDAAVSPETQNLNANEPKFESENSKEREQNLTPQGQADVLLAASDAAQAQGDSQAGKTAPSNLSKSAVNSAQNPQLQANLNLAAEPKFAPDLESMRDDTHDFHEAYSLKFKTDEDMAAGLDLAFLDDELRRLESRNAAKDEQVGDAGKFERGHAPLTSASSEPPFDPDDVNEMFSEAADYGENGELFGAGGQATSENAAAGQHSAPQQNGDIANGNASRSLNETGTDGVSAYGSRNEAGQTANLGADIAGQNSAERLGSVNLGNGVAAFDATNFSGDELQNAANFGEAHLNEANLSEQSQNGAQANLAQGEAGGRVKSAQSDVTARSNLTQAGANLTTQNQTQNLTAKAQTDPKVAKNQAVLKEARRLFGEPEILGI